MLLILFIWWGGGRCPLRLSVSISTLITNLIMIFLWFVTFSMKLLFPFQGESVFLAAAVCFAVSSCLPSGKSFSLPYDKNIKCKLKCYTTKIFHICQPLYLLNARDDEHSASNYHQRRRTTDAWERRDTKHSPKSEFRHHQNWSIWYYNIMFFLSFGLRLCNVSLENYTFNQKLVN